MDTVPVINHSRMQRVYEHGECQGMSKKSIFGFIILAIIMLGVLKRYKDVQSRKSESRLYY